MKWLNNQSLPKEVDPFIVKQFIRLSELIVQYENGGKCNATDSQAFPITGTTVFQIDLWSFLHIWMADLRKKICILCNYSFFKGKRTFKQFKMVNQKIKPWWTSQCCSIDSCSVESPHLFFSLYSQASWKFKMSLEYWKCYFMFKRPM